MDYFDQVLKANFSTDAPFLHDPKDNKQFHFFTIYGFCAILSS